VLLFVNTNVAIKTKIREETNIFIFLFFLINDYEYIYRITVNSYDINTLRAGEADLRF